MYSVSEEYKYNIVDCKTLALIGMLFYRTSIWNEGITCSRQLENIVGTVALWDVWFILLWYRVSSLETIDKIWTVRWKFVIITDSQYETTDRNGQLNSKVKLQIELFNIFSELHPCVSKFTVYLYWRQHFALFFVVFVCAIVFEVRLSRSTLPS